MRQRKPYKKIIWEIIKADDKIFNARKPEELEITESNTVCDIEATTASGEYYFITLWKNNTLSYSTYGITEIYLTPTQRRQLQEDFSREFGSAYLHIGAIMERNDKIIFCITAFIHYRWMGLREFRRCAGNMSATIDRCIEWFKQRLPDFVQRVIDFDFLATHTLLIEK